MPRRARISDNDPLNKTEKVLERFEQNRQSASEPVEQLTSQQDMNDEPPKSEEAEPLANQPTQDEVNEQPSILLSEPAINTTSQTDDKNTSKTRSPASQSTLKETELPASTKTEDSTSYQVDKPTSQKSMYAVSQFKLYTYTAESGSKTTIKHNDILERLASRI